MTDDPMPCGKCGEPHRRCTGHRKESRGGGPCMQWPKRGQTVCHMHGGSSPQAESAATQRQAEAAADEALRRLLDNRQAPPVSDPINELLALAGRARWALDAMGERVNELQDRLRYESPGQGTEQLRSEVALWERMMSRLHTVLVDLAKLDVDERRVRLAESQGELVAHVVQQICEAVLSMLLQAGMPEGFAVTFRESVREVAPRELRALASGQEEQA